MSASSRWILFFVKVVGLTFVLLIASALGARLLPPVASGEAGDGAASALGTILAVLFLQTLALALVALRSRWSGLRLTLAIAVLFFGTTTFLSQIESLVYLGGRMPEGMLAGLVAMGSINALVLAPLTVLVLGRWRRSAGGEPAMTAPAALARPWPWARLAVAALVFLCLYYLFGYYVAWQSPEVRDYYGGTDPGSFLAQMASVARGTPWMLPFQYLRSLVWAGLALLVVRSTRGPWWHAGFGASLLFTVPALYLLLPNPMMPDAVRLAHLAETVPYQFVYGWFAAWWLREPGETRPARAAGRGAAADLRPAH